MSSASHSFGTNLVLKLTKSAISSDCATLTVIDSTGNYNASTNPTGYGAPNEIRSNLYLKVIVTLKKSTGDEIITIPAYNENTASSWALTITNDGWYELYMFGCRAWSAIVTYSLGHVVYDAGTDKFYYAVGAGINNSVSDTLYWAEATTKIKFTEAFTSGEFLQTHIYDCTLDILEKCRANQCLADAMVEEECGCECDPCKISKYERIKRKIEAADIFSATIDNYTNAQKMIESLEKICTCTCNCG